MAFLVWFVADSRLSDMLNPRRGASQPPVRRGKVTSSPWFPSLLVRPILAVPQSKGKAQTLLVVAEASDAILAQ
jgi:hypothetical protein